MSWQPQPFQNHLGGLPMREWGIESMYLSPGEAETHSGSEARVSGAVTGHRWSVPQGQVYGPSSVVYAAARLEGGRGKGRQWAPTHPRWARLGARWEEMGPPLGAQVARVVWVCAPVSHMASQGPGGHTMGFVPHPWPLARLPPL